jgi:GNAT superfamily N-acetyltransferase
VTVRGASAADAERIAEVHLRAAQQGLAHVLPAGAAWAAPTVLVNDWRSRLGQQTGFVADLGAGALAGVILAGPDDADPHLGQLSRLYVDPVHWGHGIGGQLFAAGLAHLRALGFADARQWVIEANPRARAWYERLGWRPTGERKPSCEGAFSGCLDGIEDVRYGLALARITGT